MKRPLAYITAAWLGGDSENAELAAQYCRTVYEAGFSPICPPLYLPLFLNDKGADWLKQPFKKTDWLSLIGTGASVVSAVSATIPFIVK